MTCPHERYEAQDQGYEDMNGEWISDWRNYAVSTCVDIDLHRYKCTMCGEVFYYSGRAKDFYERGERGGIFTDTSEYPDNKSLKPLRQT